MDLERESRRDRDFSLTRLLREFRRPLLFGLVLVVIDGLMTLAGPIMVRIGIDNGVSAGSSTVLFAAAGVFLVATLVDLVDEIGETFVTGRAAQRIMLSLRIRIWAQLQRLSLDYYEREMAGRIMTRMTTDVDQFEVPHRERAALRTRVDGHVRRSRCGARRHQHRPRSLHAVGRGAARARDVVFRKKAARLYSMSRERIAIVNADFQESLSGVREAQAFVHEDAANAQFHRLGRRYLDARVSAQRLVATYFPFVQFMSAVADAIVLGVGAQLIASGQLTAGALIAFLLYIDLFFSPIQQLSQVFDAWQQTRVSVGRISELMQLDTITPDPAIPESTGRLRGNVALTDVHFSYPIGIGGQAVVRRERPAPRPGRRAHCAARVTPSGASRRRRSEASTCMSIAGETVALVGETGAGKSTVMKLLARFYDPDEGSVQVDGHDLRNIDLRAFRRQLGYVPQEAFLFSGSIRDNIAYGRPDASDARVEAAARAVGAHDFIARLAGGYHHELSERGRSLSSGQRQLIALARAELVDPALLLLDEATSNLDLVTEAHVAAAMQEVSHGRTTVVIAHRLQTARAADRIIVMHGGKIVEVGSHDDLLARSGRYASMWEAFELVGHGAA